MKKVKSNYRKGGENWGERAREERSSSSGLEREKGMDEKWANFELFDPPTPHGSNKIEHNTPQATARGGGERRGGVERGRRSAHRYRYQNQKEQMSR